MLRLMKKFSFIFIIFIILAVGLVFPLFNHDRLTGPNPLTLNFVFILAPYLFFVVLGAVYMHEGLEQKSNGYAFLRMLPVGASDIVIPKFLLVFLSVLVYVGFHCVAFAKISSAPSYFGPSCSFLIINGNVCLILTAAFYIGIFRYGYAKVGKFLVLFWLLIVLSPIPINILLLRRLGIARQDIIEKIVSLNWVIVTLACVALYILLMGVAVKILAKQTLNGD